MAERLVIDVAQRQSRRLAASPGLSPLESYREVRLLLWCHGLLPGACHNGPMRKRLALIGIMVALLFIGWFALRPAPRCEPLYQGRTLTQWLMDYHDALRPIPGYNGAEILQRSTNAVRA